MKKTKKDYSKCPKCHQQIYIIVGDSEEGWYHCYKANPDLSEGEEVEIAEGSRLDRADEVIDGIDYTCNLALAQGVLKDFESTACGEINCKSEQELIWTNDYDNIKERKTSADEKYSELEESESSIPTDWIKQNIKPEMLEDEDFARWALEIDGILLEHFSKKIKSNLEIVKVAISNSVNACLFIDESLLTKKKSILSLLESQCELFDNINVNKDWFNEKEFMEGVIEIRPSDFYKYIGSSLWNDIDFIKQCILKDGNIITSEKFPKELLNDQELMIRALINSTDTDSMVLALPIDILCDLNFWQKVKSNPDVYFWSKLYKFFPEKLKTSKEEFTAAIDDSDDAFIYAPENFKAKKAILDFIKNKVKHENTINDDFAIFARSMEDDEINKQLDLACKKELCSNPWDDGDALNTFAWRVYEKKRLFPDYDIELKRAIVCCKRSIEVKECHEILDTYSHVLFASGEFKNALIQENNAVELANKLGYDSSVYLEFIEVIKQKL
jgi:hypothetical protein